MNQDRETSAAPGTGPIAGGLNTPMVGYDIVERWAENRRRQALDTAIKIPCLSVEDLVRAAKTIEAYLNGDNPQSAE